ncbi:MAG: pyridoxal phosphate-dependent aminotransferase [Thermoanaerobaculia bacterium]
MTVRLSRRAAALAPSSTAEVGRAAKALVAAGADLVDFGVGEPDFPTPEFVAEAGVAAIRAGRTKYTDVSGDGALREAVAEKYRREQGTRCAGSNVLVTAGAKQAIFNACQVLFEAGDEVAIFRPYWVSFPEIVRLSGATPTFVDTLEEEGWKPTVSALDRAAGPATRGVILNSPNNPTGAVVEPRELAAILRWCADREAWLLFDETYDRFLYDGAIHASAARLWDEHSARIVVTGSASKTFAMTGWRLGWALAEPEVVSAMSSFQSHSTSNACSISQEAARVALSDLSRSEAAVEGMLAEYARRRDAMREGLSGAPGVRLSSPEGAFYVFADVAGLCGRKGIGESADLCRRLLEEAHVAAVSGDAFGAEMCVRFSFATSLERIREGTRRFTAWARA